AFRDYRCIFFFSSRRRHTRCYRDWSSDVCSSDLGEWWSAFHDDELNALEKQALDANQTIKIAAARLEQARASAALQIATQFPTRSEERRVGKESRHRLWAAQRRKTKKTSESEAIQ